MITVNMDTTNQSFDYWWTKEGTWFEEPNQRRGGFSGVLTTVNDKNELLFIKRQEAHIFRSIRYPFSAPTILREYHAYLALDKINIKTPELVYCGRQAKKAILVTKALTGFISLEQWLNERAASGNIDTSASLQIMESIGHTLAQMHKHRLQHNCLHSKHFFICIHNASTPEIALLDLEKMRKRLSVKQAASHDMLHLKKHTKPLLQELEWQHLITSYHQKLGITLPELLS